MNPFAFLCNLSRRFPRLRRVYDSADELWRASSSRCARDGAARLTEREAEEEVSKPAQCPECGGVPGWHALDCPLSTDEACLRGFTNSPPVQPASMDDVLDALRNIKAGPPDEPSGCECLEPCARCDEICAYCRAVMTGTHLSGSELEELRLESWRQTVDQRLDLIDAKLEDIRNLLRHNTSPAVRSKTRIDPPNYPD